MSSFSLSIGGAKKSILLFLAPPILNCSKHVIMVEGKPKNLAVELPCTTKDGCTL